MKENGTPITARGVKLMAAGALVEMVVDQAKATVESVADGKQAALESSVQPTSEAASITAQPTSKVAPVPVGRLRQKVGLLRFPVETRDRWNYVLMAISPQEASKLEQMSTLLEWVEARLEPPSESQRIPDQAEAIPAEATELMQVKDALAAVLQRLDKLEAERSTPVKPQGRKPQKAEARDKSTATPTARKLGGAADRANNIFLAVQAWNRQHPDQTFAITLSVLKDEFGIISRPRDRS
ncbi:MAG TPA: hypothetical protein V6D18_21495 [Thermosynechococcaceae cyanobacterium]